MISVRIYGSKAFKLGFEIGWIYLTIYFLFWEFSIGDFREDGGFYQ